MDILIEALRLVFLLLLNCELRDCYGVTCTGELTVDKDIIPIGSNLTVHCRSYTVRCGRIFIIEFNGKKVLRKTSCSNVTAHVVVNEPKSSISCSVEQGGKSHIVCGRDITANPIPSPPHIKEIAFAKGSLSPTIYWHSSDNMENLKPVVRFRKANDASDWMEGNVIRFHRGTLALLGTLTPLTSYQFKMRVCTVSMKYNCSLWSKMFTQSSPGKAPSTKLDVWRIIMITEQSHIQNVTLMWKVGKEDGTGVLHHYEISYREKGTTHILNCSVAATQYTVQLPLEVTELNISAVTSAGSSPPATVRLNCSGIPSPEIKSSHAAGGGINLTWDLPPFSERMSEQNLGYVVQWQCTPNQMQWKRYVKNYNTSVYILEMLVIKSNKPLCSFSDAFAVGLCLVTAVPIIILVNLIYLKCTRQRIRKACVSMGPSWLFQNLPKLGNSNAIKLLKDESCGSDLYWQPVDSDPPLSPVEDCSPPMERKVLYPIVHKEVTTEERVIVQDWTVSPYKPQITISQGAEAACDVTEKEEDEPPWGFFSLPVFTFEQRIFPSKGMHASLPSCLTVDGRPVSMNLVDGFPFFTPATLEGNMVADGRFVETESVYQNQHQSQALLPNVTLHSLQVDEQLL
ncbi:interleukin 23 receptor [Silurus asotus]|uniref:Interleukin 23 receptor n=1 Tax=Silurus asotus TaxID=30991 RepID=A0AAD5FG42_SILAS|nr:interleukin 23 receptor [Silurus asotus]